FPYNDGTTSGRLPFTGGRRPVKIKASTPQPDGPTEEWPAMPDDRIPMTRQDFDDRKAELERLQAKLKDVTQQVATAREMGDLSENAEYHAAREIQGMTQAKINQIQDELSRAYL